MDFITLLVCSVTGMLILTVLITFISKKQIERTAILRDISDAVMDFDKIDELKKKGLSLKYFAKLQEAEQQTIEAKILAAESVEELFFLYERAQSLPPKGFRKTVENTLVQVIDARLRHLAILPAPDQTGEILKELYEFERVLKNISAPDTEQQIYSLKRKHTIVSETMKASLKKLAETS